VNPVALKGVRVLRGVAAQVEFESNNFLKPGFHFTLSYIYLDRSRVEPGACYMSLDQLVQNKQRPQNAYSPTMAAFSASSAALGLFLHLLDLVPLLLGGCLAGRLAGSRALSSSSSFFRSSWSTPSAAGALRWAPAPDPEAPSAQLRFFGGMSVARQDGVELVDGEGARRARQVARRQPKLKVLVLFVWTIQKYKKQR
jgi:hypothetical protein